MLTTNLLLEQEDKEGEDIEGCNDGERKDALLCSSCRLILEDCEQAARWYVSREITVQSACNSPKIKVRNER